MQFLTRAIFVLAAFAGVMTNAAPTPAAQDVWTPKIISPNNDTVWSLGSTQTVVWDTSAKPTQVTNPKATVYLRRNGNTDLTRPLASGFELSDGSVEVQVPDDIPAADDYQIDLFGDSGDFSPYFSIVEGYY